MVFRNMLKSVENLFLHPLYEGLVGLWAALHRDECDHLVADGLRILRRDQSLGPLLQLGVLLLDFPYLLLLLILVPVARVHVN